MEDSLTGFFLSALTLTLHLFPSMSWGVSDYICKPVSRCLLPSLSLHFPLELAQLPPSPASRPGDPVDVPAAVPGAGKGRCLEPGVGPCLPPGCPAGSCQCCPRLWLLKAPLLPPTPWGPNPERQVRTEEGGGIDTRSSEAPSSGGFIHLHSGATGEVPFYPLQTSSDGTLCPNLRAQLCRMWW